MHVPVPVPVLDLKTYDATTGTPRMKWQGLSQTKTNMAGASTNELCCWMRIAQKQSMTPNFFYSMISIRVQICIYHIGNMTAFH